MKPLPVCLTFPGQGSQYVGMLKEAKDVPAVSEMLAKAKTILNYDILEIMLTGPAEKMGETKFCQPAMYVAGLAALEMLRASDPSKVSRCQAMAGLSLGEYAALTAAGVFDFSTGLELVKLRAEAMDFQTSKSQQAMLTVAGLEKALVEKLCKECSTKGESCQIANCLFPKGYAVGGSSEAVKMMEKKAIDAGALQAKLLPTSGAFHTPLMKDVKEEVTKKLDKVKGSMNPPKCCVYMNSTGKTITSSTSVDEIVKLIGEQIVSQVMWEQSMQMAIRDGISEFYELGPSKQLKAMMKRIDPKIAEKMVNISV